MFEFEKPSLMFKQPGLLVKDSIQFFALLSIVVKNTDLFNVHFL